MMTYQTVIGLEVHVQLLTKSKMFCDCSSKYQNEPTNSIICPICLGLPGSLPNINQMAINLGIKTSLALNCEISSYTKFDRKNYSYPDLMKGYQISQFDLPLATNGFVKIMNDNNDQSIRINRLHLEEDVAKLIHINEKNNSYSLIDINRSGVPLMEIVTEPDIKSPEEAREYLIKLRSIIKYLDVGTGNMEEGSFRCDANISLKKINEKKLGTKVEIKNLNSLKSVYRALKYEIKRQTTLLNSEKKIIQETRGWSEINNETVAQRTKEYAADYRYFPEPDLPLIKIEKKFIEDIKNTLPELPEEKSKRFQKQYQLNKYNSDLLTINKQTAEFYESTVKNTQPTFAKSVSNWMLGELNKLLKKYDKNIDQQKIIPKNFKGLLKLIESGKLNNASAKIVFEDMFLNGGDPKEISLKKNLIQSVQDNDLEPIIEKIISDNPKAIKDFISGNENVLKFLVGQVMKETKGKANPKNIENLLSAQLSKLNK
ncbi:MAG: Asp-tRNA(Asn)/Glu-tRNA(Gln) amidotransferase GatCAB subunit B [Chloroflexi bacterium]|nr:Asp-tRNA(Asn)/Glu-tRNA(Gln) amidotransferase GatCAB subunit B [Chloroflexota bacterium]